MSLLMIIQSWISLLLLITAQVETPTNDLLETFKDEYWLHKDVVEEPHLKLGPFIRLPDGKILTAEGVGCYVSADEGKTWTMYPVFEDSSKFFIRPERALVLTKEGTVVLAFINDREVANWNWQEDIHDSPGCIAPTYAIRSTDYGKTWGKPQKLHDDWTGAIRDVVETRAGNIVFTSMMMQHNPGHHSVVTYTSKDDGKNWTRSNVIDLGGVGHHGGVTEATIEQLNDGRLWMLMRTNWGVFWEAYSEDEGLTWKLFSATDIDASSAPGFLKRLKSGRLVLVWNRQFPEGQTSYPMRGGDGNWSEVPVSNHREEVSIMFSDDDGKNWTLPVVIAKIREKGGWASYPYIFEAQPGELWVTLWFGELRIKLSEKDFT